MSDYRLLPGELPIQNVQKDELKECLIEAEMTEIYKY